MTTSDAPTNTERAITTVCVALEDREDGGLRVFSDELPGLILSGSDKRAVEKKIEPAIAALFKERTAKNVTVIAARPVAEILATENGSQRLPRFRTKTFVVEFTNTERCGGDVERIRERHAKVSADQAVEPAYAYMPLADALQAHKDRGTLLDALAEERATGERMAGALKKIDQATQADRPMNSAGSWYSFSEAMNKLISKIGRMARTALASP